MSGILKTQLVNLEKSAETLERIVLKDLTALHSMPDYADLEGYEAKILRKAHRLDEIQDEIDATVAKLKATGLHEPVSYSGNTYEYKPVKYERPKPEVKAKVKEAKAAVEADRQAVREAKKEAAKQALQDAREARQAAKEADRLAAIAAREAAREAKLLRVPKAKPAPKPRRAAESKEIKLAKKRRDSVTCRIRRLEGQIAAERASLEQRLAERHTRIAEVANQSTADHGPQNRRNAQIGLENVQRQLDGLDSRYELRLYSLTEQLNKAVEDVQTLTAVEYPHAKDSQLV